MDDQQQLIGCLSCANFQKEDSMPTEKLYWVQPLLQRFESRLVSQEQTADLSGAYRIQLEKTAFYPEGGGQPADRGWINGVPVLHVFEEMGIVWHVTASKIPGADTEASPVVSAEIDWERRFDHMQQHLGQHILSAAFYEILQAKTIGFHLGEKMVTIDIDGRDLTQKLTTKIESRANGIIFRNLPVLSQLVSESEYRAMDLRKTPEISDIVRIVQVEGFDSVACGGTHPEATGSVGLVKIIKTEPYKGGSRITFVCGSRALNIFSAMQHELLQSASLLSVGWSELGSAIESIQNESKHQKKIMKNLQIEWASLEAGRLVSGGSIINDVTIIQQQYDDIEPGQLQRLANTLKIIPGRIILLSAAKPSARVLLISTADHPDLSMKELLQDHIHYINGTGGGNKSSAQGGGVKTEGLSEMMSMMQQSVVSHLAQV
jgi:alanyl-tRNA synthetase